MLRSVRLTIVHLALVAFAVALVARAAQVQLWQGREWLARAQRQQFGEATLPAARGTIADITGVPLVESRPVVALRVAPREVRDRRQVARLLERLGVPRAWVRRASDTARAWVEIPGRYLPMEAAPLVGLRGVYAEPGLERVYTTREATRRLVGRADASGNGMDGVELALDSVLRGQSGRALLLRDARGGRGEPPFDTTVAPRAGADVVLTISQPLQEIAQRALGDAVRALDASGGDIVVLDPYSGEIRALASERRDPRSTGSPALSEPFEPGSTVKPFFAAALLRLGRARPTDVVDTENGSYTIEGRTLRDTHPAAALSLADVLRYSSNIGITKFVQRLSPREEFEALRDVGFGTPTGVAYPAEAGGVLRSPERWSRQSRASLAIGYELTVTPVQLAAAYGAIANGGELVAPALVREIRDADGRVLYSHRRRVVRRVMDSTVAATVRRMLVATVDSGTATAAGLGTFELAGKTGTARRAGEGGVYQKSSYTASFVGLFPADRPQYVIVVKLDDPQGAEYGGGATAAPVSRVVLQAALAARDAALDREALARSEALAGSEAPRFAAAAAPTVASRGATTERSPTLPVTAPAVTAPARTAFAETAPADSSPVAEREERIVLPYAPPPAMRRVPRRVPDVRGLPARAAALALHRAGFRVEMTGAGDAAGTAPAPGTVLRQGALVRVVSDQ